MALNKTSKFDTAPLLLLLARRESPNRYLDLDTSIYSRWEDLKAAETSSPAQRKEKEMLHQVIEWFSIANEFQRQRESEK